MAVSIACWQLEDPPLLFTATGDGVEDEPS